MKDKMGHLKTDKREYPICFNLNVLEEIQNRYGSLSKWGEICENTENNEPNIKEFKIGLMLMINEAIEIENETCNEKKELVNEKQVGRIISDVGYESMKEIILNLSSDSTKTDNDLKNV